jgi:hypothetical protein
MSLQLSGDGVVTGLDSLASSDLGTQLGSKLDTTTASSTYLPIAGGKILQIVRATDTTLRSTTSTTFTDVTGMSVTITPQVNTSAVLIISIFRTAPQASTDDTFCFYQITDASNNTISGAEIVSYGTSNLTGTGTRNVATHLSIVAYATPATINATTYKLRFRSQQATTTNRIANDLNTGQMYAIEVSA